MVRKKQGVKDAPLVSVNIRTLNSEKYIEKTLESITLQTYKNIEVIASDGYSRDGTIEILKKFKAKVNYADKLGDARAQNLKNSKGTYIMSVDSDQVLDRNLIKTCVNRMKKGNLTALTISEKSLIDKKSTLLQQIIAFDKEIIDKSRDDDAVFGTACPRFFRRDLLKRIKWPEELSIFDDTILYAEILSKGGKTGYLTRPSIYHHEVASWRMLIKKFFRYGRGYLKAFSQRPGTIAAHSLPRRSYFSEAALGKPSLFLGLLLLYIVKVLSATAGASWSIVVGMIGTQK